MAVDKQLLEECILEAADGDKEMAEFLRDRYSKNESAASKFVGGFTRTRDYTQKTQALANERKTLEGRTAEIDNLRKTLEAAEDEKNKIMRDLASARITTGKAQALMQLLQEKYNLTDEDLPGMSELIETRKTGKVVDDTPPLEDRLKTFGADLMKQMEDRFVKTLMPELGAMANLPIVWGEIAREHQELTGKRLTAAEQQDILKTARESNQPLRAVWEDKFKISGDDGLRMQKRDERLKAQWQSDFEKQQAEKRSREALEVVTPAQRELGDGAGISAAFKTRFREYEMDPNKPAVASSDGIPSLAVQPGQHVRRTGDRGPRAAERAAVKFLEQRSGKPQKVA